MTPGSKHVRIAPAQPISLSIEQMSVPLPRDGEFVVLVEASSVNPVDVKRSVGKEVTETHRSTVESRGRGSRGLMSTLRYLVASSS